MPSMTIRRRLVLAALLVLCAIPQVLAAPQRRTPRLVVILVVDQMRADYVEKFGAQWTGGFRTLMNEGAWFREAQYPYMTMVTCAGHSTIVTGSLPYVHGIVSNAWWDRQTQKSVNCVADAEQGLVSYGAPANGGTSTRNLRVPTLGDELRLQLKTAPRVVTLSMKDYVSTTMAGRAATAATWFNLGAHSWMTSTFFTKTPVPFIADYVKAHPIEQLAGQAWTKVLPDSAYVYDDNGVGEAAPKGWTAMFPHPLEGTPTAPSPNFYQQWEESPYSDRYLGQLAEYAVDTLKLGQQAGTDYLAISFSALDVVGHDFGPRSQEVQDILAHLDRTLDSLIKHLDRSVGRANYVLSLAADHGVAPIPEQLPAFGITGGRIKTTDLLARLNKLLEPALGAGTHAVRISYADLYFAPGVWEKLSANPPLLQSVIDMLRAEPGIAQVYRGEELRQPLAAGDDPIKRAASYSYFPGRSGDLIIVPRPYWLPGTSGTGHGAPYAYDQRVPLFLLGQGIKGGQYLTAASPVDIAPTFAFLAGITLPAPSGRVLNEALEAIPAPGAGVRAQGPAVREKAK